MRKHRHLAVYVVVDPDLGLARVEAMQPAGVLDEGALPRDRQRQKERVQAGVVEALANVPTRGQDEALFVGREFGKLRRRGLPSTRGHAPVEHHEVPGESSSEAITSFRISSFRLSFAESAA